MPSREVPVRPLVVILGSTGTGKSELAIELALRFRGEIINTDAMQLYRGLPVITNKIPLEEQRGVPHHLLDHIPLDQAPWDVDEFKKEAFRVIDDIRSRGNLPVLVGGTQYYVNALLFKDVTLDVSTDTYTARLAMLDEPNKTIWEELRKVDPVMAAKWHPNDRRKIQRSLRIFLTTGQRASDLYAEQEKRKSDRTKESWDNLLFWVCSEKDTLTKRLDDRVDKMLQLGLVDEVEELCRFKAQQHERGNMLDMQKGIWQSIGFKQLEPYLTAKSEEKGVKDLDKLKSQGLEDMKAATRRYANYQDRWTRLKQIPLLDEHGSAAVNSLYVLDSTDISAYKQNVVDEATVLTEQFLKGEERKMPFELSRFAKEMLEKVTRKEEDMGDIPCRRTCEVCGTVCLTERAWNQHIRGTAHRRTVKKKNKLALVPVEAIPIKTVAEASDKGQMATDEGLGFDGLFGEPSTSD